MRSPQYPKVDPRGLLQRSLARSERVPVGELRRISRSIPVRKAFRRIANGVLAMPWQVKLPIELTDDDAAHERARLIRKAISQPNQEPGPNTYSKMVRALVNEILTLGVAAIERIPGNEKTQPFWWFIADAAQIQLNPDWSPQNEGFTPLFYDFSRSSSDGGRSATPLLRKEMFLIQMEASSYELVCPSPLEIAYKTLCAWLRVGEFQDETVGKAVRSYLLSVEGEDVDEETLTSLREYWRLMVEGRGEIPILGGKVNKVDLGAKNDDELYPRFTEYLLRLLGLALDLSARDFNIAEPDNRATAIVAADLTFAQAVLPMSKCIEEHLNLELVEYYTDCTLELTDTEPRGEAEEAKVSGDMYEKGLITRNEGRQRIGQNRIPTGDVFYDGTGIDEDESPAPLPAPPELKRTQSATRGKTKTKIAAQQLNLFDD